VIVMRRLFIAILAVFVALGSGPACAKGGGDQPGASGVPGY
jgi:hypothetical protein